MPRRFSQRSRTLDIAVAGGFIVFIIVMVIVGTRTAGGGSSQAQPSVSSSTLATPSASADVHGEGAEAPCELDTDKLRQLSKEFIPVWALILPNDTTEDRRARLAPLVAKDFFTLHNVEIYVDLPAEQARKASGTSIVAAPSDEVEVFCTYSADFEAATETKTTTWKEDPTGKKITTPRPIVVSINWMFDGTSWIATEVETTRP